MFIVKNKFFHFVYLKNLHAAELECVWDCKMTDICQARNWYGSFNVELQKKNYVTKKNLCLILLEIIKITLHIHTLVYKLFLHI